MGDTAWPGVSSGKIRRLNNSWNQQYLGMLHFLCHPPSHQLHSFLQPTMPQVMTFLQGRGWHWPCSGQCTKAYYQISCYCYIQACQTLPLWRAAMLQRDLIPALPCRSWQPFLWIRGRGHDCRWSIIRLYIGYPIAPCITLENHGTPAILSTSFILSSVCTHEHWHAVPPNVPEWGTQPWFSLSIDCSDQADSWTGGLRLDFRLRGCTSREGVTSYWGCPPFHDQRWLSITGICFCLQTCQINQHLGGLNNRLSLTSDLLASNIQLAIQYRPFNVNRFCNRPTALMTITTIHDKS